MTYQALLNIYYRMMEWLIPSDFCLVDMEDNFVLAMGTFEEVELAMDQSYGGTFSIFRLHELPDGCDTTAVEPF
jgi:hypothetical protein